MADFLPDCPLCRLEQCIIGRDEHWTIALNDDQGYLGRCFFALNRHETDVTALQGDELSTLWAWFRRVKAALDGAFRPDHYNYVLLMNVQPHLHAHIIPRYASDREFDGVTFHDGRIGAHYDLENAKIPSAETRERIADAIRKHLPSSPEGTR